MGSFFRSLRRPFTTPASRTRGAFRARLGVEALEQRQLLSVTSMEAVALQHPSPHTGTTQLYLNFDGDTSQKPLTSTGPWTDRDVQDILFRTAERFAPFDVDVIGAYQQGWYAKGKGATTVFIGPDTDPSKPAQAYTPSASTDKPSFFPGISLHLPNSNSEDYAYVEPSGIWSNDKISMSVAHEAGHTFGLVHVRTTGTDPDPLKQGPAGVPDVMRYDGTTKSFLNQSFPITAYNWNPSKQQAENTGAVYYWYPDQITKQNSFQYLKAVLGSRLADDVASIVHTSSVDLTAFKDSPAQSFGSGISKVPSGVIDRYGDYDVFTITATSSTPITFQVGSSGNLLGAHLDPMILVYDTSDGSLVGFDHGSGGLPSSSRTTLWAPVAGRTYAAVVGAENNLSMGAYWLTAKVSWDGLPAPTLSIDRVQVFKSDLYAPHTVLFHVTLSHPWKQSVLIDYAVANGDNIAGLLNIHGSSGQLTFSGGAGDLVHTIAVQVSGKIYGGPKGDHFFHAVTLSHPVQATLANSVGVLELKDDMFDVEIPGHKQSPNPKGAGWSAAGLAFAAPDSPRGPAVATNSSAASPGRPAQDGGRPVPSPAPRQPSTQVSMAAPTVRAGQPLALAGLDDLLSDRFGQLPPMVSDLRRTVS